MAIDLEKKRRFSVCVSVGKGTIELLEIGSDMAPVRALSSKGRGKAAFVFQDGKRFLIDWFRVHESHWFSWQEV